jgi:hypothetical protein
MTGNWLKIALGEIGKLEIGRLEIGVLVIGNSEVVAVVGAAAEASAGWLVVGIAGVAVGRIPLGKGVGEAEAASSLGVGQAAGSMGFRCSPSASWARPQPVRSTISVMIKDVCTNLVIFIYLY